MSLFPLQTASVTFRGRSFNVREMTVAEKMEWARAVKIDRGVTLTMAAAMCTTCDDGSTMTAESMAGEPSQFIERLAEKIFDLSDIEWKADGAPEGEKKG